MWYIAVIGIFILCNSITACDVKQHVCIIADICRTVMHYYTENYCMAGVVQIFTFTAWKQSGGENKKGNHIRP